MNGQSERAKMLAGEVYDIFDPELVAERERTKNLLRLYNSAEGVSDREALLGQLLREVGRGATIEPPFFCSYGRNTSLGDRVYLNFLCVILDNGEVRIGSRVMLGPGVHIYTAQHPLQAEARNKGLEVASPVSIDDDVWIGGAAVILPGVTIGRGAVVGAGSVVTRDVPAHAVVAGNPARVLRKIDAA